MNNIQLPSIDKEGIPYISYSQIKNWNELKGFNTGKLGKEEYMLSYFFKQKFEDKGGFGQFGSDVEDYICERKGAEKFSDDEKKLLQTIKPLGIFQKEIKIPFDGFYLKGYIDDCDPAYTIVRDYKTASDKSRSKYEEDSYNQLYIYALGIKALTGKLPKKLEVCIIERLGNGFRGGRNVMTVGENIWYVEKKITKEKLKLVEKEIIDTANDISDTYKVFCKLNK